MMSTGFRLFRYETIIVDFDTREEEFHDLLDDVADGVGEKLDISEAVMRRSSSKTAANMVSDSSRVNEKIIEPEIEAYRRDLKKQFSRLLESVEEDKNVHSQKEKLLKHDIFYQNLESHSEEVERKVMERLESLHNAISRIKDSQEEDVWDAVHDKFTRREAEKFIDDMFGFMSELESHEDELTYRKNVDMSKISKILPFDIEVDYTPEALEVMKESEKEVREEMEAKIDQLYEKDDDTPIKL